MKMYMLRSDVQVSELSPNALHIQLSSTEHAGFFKDPRHDSLGYRQYFEGATKENSASAENAYFLRRFVAGIPEAGHDGYFEGIIPFLLNLDLINGSKILLPFFLFPDLFFTPSFIYERLLPRARIDHSDETPRRNSPAIFASLCKYRNI